MKIEGYICDPLVGFTLPNLESADHIFPLSFKRASTVDCMPWSKLGTSMAFMCTHLVPSSSLSTISIMSSPAKHIHEYTLL